MNGRIRNHCRYLLFTFCIGLLSGCASGEHPQILTSTSPLPAGVRGTVPAYGSNCQTYLLGLIPISNTPDTQEALIEAKESADADVLTDVTVDHNSFYYILISRRCVRVRGLGVPRR